MTSVRVEVYVQPGASRTEVAGMHDGLIKIRVAAPPADNAANRALIEFVAGRLGVPKRSVTVVAGGSHRRKLLQIEGVSAGLIAQRLSPVA